MGLQVLQGKGRKLLHSDGGKKKGINTYVKRAVVDMLNEYKQSQNLDFLEPKTQQSCPAR